MLHWHNSKILSYNRYDKVVKVKFIWYFKLNVSNALFHLYPKKKTIKEVRICFWKKQKNNYIVAKRVIFYLNDIVSTI